MAGNEVPGALELKHFYEGDREYIIARHDEWLSYAPVMRTRDQTAPILMTLGDARGRSFQLSIPDLSGETFKTQFEDRTCNRKVAEAIPDVAGIGVFISPSRIEDPTRIRDVWATIDAATTSEMERETPEAASTPAVAPSAAEEEPAARAEQPPVDFETDHCCTQVQYVDLLQQLLDQGARTPIRCAIILSAIDVLDGTPYENNPASFIRDRMSLLDQFLRARPDLFSFRIFGVSAQGGSYDKPASIDAIASLGAARIRVCTDGAQDNDISRPIKWLAFGDE